MVIDKIENAHLYYGIGERIAAGLKFLQQGNVAEMACGRYEIEGCEVYAVVSSYDSKIDEKALFEAHRNYIDIQYIASGCERIGAAHIGLLKEAKEYDEANDFMLYEGTGDFFVAGEGTFAIFWPHDAHMPSMAADKPQNVKKVVVKVRV